MGTFFPEFQIDKEAVEGSLSGNVGQLTGDVVGLVTGASEITQGTVIGFGGGATLVAVPVGAAKAGYGVLVVRQSAIALAENITDISELLGRQVFMTEGAESFDPDNPDSGINLPSEENAGLDDVNPGFRPDVPSDPRSLNCINCAIATDQLLAGNSSSALPASDGPGTIFDLENIYNSSFRPTTEADIVTELQAAGPGSRAIIYGERVDPSRGIDGHVFNAINQNGVIKFLDGQSNTSLNSTSGFSQLGIMRTN